MRARIRLCGHLEIELDGRRVEDRLPGRQGPLVVALLALNRSRPVPRDELIGALWPAELPADPEESLSALLSKVRQAVGRDTLTGRRELTLALPDDAEVDVEEAFAASARAQAAGDRAEWTTAWEAASSAAEIAGRGFLVGHEGPWVDERRVELDELRLRALELVALAGIALGGARLDAGERAARELARAAPLREAGHRLLMEALAARGEVAEALAAYERLRVSLRDELGATPGEAVRAVHERLLAGEPARTRPRPTGPAVRVPLPAPLARAERASLVGRERELERLDAAWARACAGGRALVVLAGDAGIGKTRLAGEAAHADGTALYGACLQDALVAYQPFIEALRHYARHRPPDAGPVGPGAAELATLIPELAGPAATGGDVAQDPETRRYLMFEAVSSLLAEAGARAPVLLVLDDLHWADRSTLRLLRHVVRAQHDVGLLVVGTYRDAEVAPGHPLAELLGGLRRDDLVERVAVEGLDEDDVETLVEDHAGHAVASGLARALHAETGGNPFFVGEMVRHLTESHVELETEASLPRELGVPHGVKEVLGLRLARLSDHCRLVLGNAAVLGREFRFEVLASMVDLDDETAVAALEEALGARLVVEQAAPLEPAYAFTHALVRETLYDGLSTPRRQRLHARAARAIESTPDPGARVAELALHYRLAGPAAEPAKAIEASLRAGDRARELFAWDETLAHWDAALTLMERSGGEPEARGRLLVALAEVCGVVGDLGRQIGFLERALDLYTAAGNEARAAQAHSRLGQAHSLIDSIHGEHLDIERAFEHFDAARPVLTRGPARTSAGHLEAGVATALTYGLRIPPGLEAGRRGMEIGEELGDELLWAAAAQTFAWHSIVGGSLSEGFALLDRSFEVADRHRRSFLAFMGSNTSGQLTWSLGAPDEAQRFLERPLHLPYVGRTAYRAEIADGVGRCHASRGELDEARALLPGARPAWISHSLTPVIDLWDGRWDAVEALARRVLETSRRTGNRWDEWAAHHLTARVHHLRGELEPAARHLACALEIVVDGGATYFELWARPDAARVDAEAGRLREARAHVDRCGEISARGEDWRGRQGMADLAEAVVVAFEGDDADARFASAYEVLRSYGLVAEQADCLHQWGLALRRAGDGPEAAEKLDAAAELYATHGAGAAWRQRLAADARPQRA